MSFQLVTFEEIKKLIGLKKSSITDYPALGIIIPSVEAAIEDHTGRKFESKAQVESVYIGMDGSRMVQLAAIPITAITEVKITDQYGTETILGVDDWRITPFGIRLYTKFKDVDVTVSYTGGYTREPTDTLPSSINRAALLQCAYEYQGKAHIGASSVQTEGGSIEKPAIRLLPEVKDRLMEYVHPLKNRVA